MPDLGRTTKGDDTVPLFDFDAYFPGKWTFEWDVPESPLGPAGRVEGTTVYTKVGDGVVRGGDRRQPVRRASSRSRKRFTYQREQKTLTRDVTDSRGFSYTQTGTDRRRPRRLLHHLFRERAVHGQRQVGSAQARDAAHVAARLSRVDDGRGRRRRVFELRHPMVAQGHAVAVQVKGNANAVIVVVDRGLMRRAIAMRSSRWQRGPSRDRAQGDGGYRLVPNWPKLPAGMYFGLKEPPPPPAEREAQAAARRARGDAAGEAAVAAGRRRRTDEPARHLGPRHRSRTIASTPSTAGRSR